MLGEYEIEIAVVLGAFSFWWLMIYDRDPRRVSLSGLDDLSQTNVSVRLKIASCLLGDCLSFGLRNCGSLTKQFTQS